MIPSRGHWVVLTWLVRAGAFVACTGALVACAGAFAGCKDAGTRARPPTPQDAARTNQEEGAAGTGAAPAPTWARDVAPLVARRCGGCHGGEGRAAVAPPRLDTYEDARRSAGSALLAVRRRMMPPFGADNTGLCGSWMDAPWLTDAEIAIFGSWVEHGSPRGEPALTRDAPEVPPRLDAASDHLATVDPGVSFAPGLGARAYRCFVLEPGRRAATAITGLTVSSEPAAAVRQAALYELADKIAVRRARELDAADPGPGWACYGAPAVNGANLLASWSRNTPVQRLPAGTGIPLARATTLVLQLRYDPIASAPDIAVRARMTLATGDVARPARLQPLRAAPFALAPGQTQARVRATWTADRATLLWGLVPRMHTLGRVLDLERARVTSPQCLAHFGHWDIYDQQLFRATHPVALAPGDQVTLTCEFATTSRAADAKMGEAPDDEQCLAHLYLVDVP